MPDICSALVSRQPLAMHASPQKYFFCRRHYRIGATRDVTRDRARMRPPIPYPILYRCSPYNGFELPFPSPQWGKMSAHQILSLHFENSLCNFYPGSTSTNNGRNNFPHSQRRQICEPSFSASVDEGNNRAGSANWATARTVRLAAGMSESVNGQRT